MLGLRLSSDPNLKLSFVLSEYHGIKIKITLGLIHAGNSAIALRL
jgi:hypothetical protein